MLYMLEPKLLLTYLDGSSPLNYGLTVTTEPISFGNVKFISFRGVPSSPSSGYTFQIEVETTEESAGNTDLKLDLGTLALHSEDGEVEVVLVDDQNAVIGRKKVRAEEAQKESRPIDEI